MARIPFAPIETDEEVGYATSEPSYLEKLYLQFILAMSNEHSRKFQELTRERKDYLFDLWLKKNGYV
jgi:hypothetical protein